MADAPGLRIVHCFRSPVGGIFRHVRDLAIAQQAEGHKVGVICDSTTGGGFEDMRLSELAADLALGVHRTPMQRHIGLGDITAASGTYRLIKKLQPDVLHGHGAKGGVYARLFGSLLRAFRYRVARLYSPHGGSLHYDDNTLTGRIFFMTEKLLSWMSDRILFVSDHERKTYFAKVGKPLCKTELVYNGLNASEFEPVTAEPGAADFLYLGMMRSLKGPDIFLDALAAVSNELKQPLSAVMVGNGDERDNLIERAAHLGLSDQVKFDMPMPARDAFSLGRIVVVPSRAEAMPYTVLEAVGAGKTLLATRVGGIPEIMGAGSPALMNPDAASVASTMRAAIKNPQLFTDAMPSIDDLRKRFSSEAMASQITAVYRDILRG